MNVIFIFDNFGTNKYVFEVEIDKIFYIRKFKDEKTNYRKLIIRYDSPTIYFIILLASSIDVKSLVMVYF